MSDATLVRGTRCGLKVVCCAAGAGAFTAGAILLGNELVALWAVVAAVFAVATLLMLPGLFVRKVYLEVLPAGFAVRDRSGHREFTDADVTGVGWDETVRMSNGVPQGMRRTATLSVGDGPPVLMDYLVRNGRPDSVAPLICRLSERVLADARDRLAQQQLFIQPARFG